MLKAKPLFIITIMTLICCSYSFGQTPIPIGKGIISNPVPVTAGIISGETGVYPSGEFNNENVYPGGIVNDGAGVYPLGGFNNAGVYIGRINSDANISLKEFQCFLISSCGMYPRGLADNTDGAKVYLDGISRMVGQGNNNT